MPLISIIMPAFNAAPYIREAIESVIAQDHANWELIVVNDGSTDDTAVILEGYHDARIKVIHQSKQGIGAARNAALAIMQGEFMATLDADDVLPQRSLSSRLGVLLDDPTLSFADGAVITMDGTLQNIIRTYTPSFRGEPFLELFLLRGTCFFGATWLIRLEPGMILKYDSVMTHGEDLMLYIELAQGRRYSYTNEVVLLYRRTGNTVMTKVDGLAKGYAHIGRWMNDRHRLVPAHIRRSYARKSTMIMVRSFLKNQELTKAIRSIFDFIFKTTTYRSFISKDPQ
jgi:glycosyltransferase involved in cell wall biosynthesis